MDFWEFFFRKKEDNFKFKAFGKVHIFMLVLMIIPGILIYLYRDKIKKNQKLYSLLKYIILVGIILDQAAFLYFHLAIMPRDFKEAFPLYTCRASLYTGFIAIALNSKKFRAMTVYWGLIGGILPMLAPDLYHYRFPHAMYINFFATHFLIFWTALIFIFVEDYDFDRRDLPFIFKFANGVLLISKLTNIFFDANYAYLERSPIMEDLFLKLPYPLYFLIVLGVYNLGLLAVYYVGRGLKKALS